jgi:hypothetical protein
VSALDPGRAGERDTSERDSAIDHAEAHLLEVRVPRELRREAVLERCPGLLGAGLRVGIGELAR